MASPGPLNPNERAEPATLLVHHCAAETRPSKGAFGNCGAGMWQDRLSEFVTLFIVVNPISALPMCIAVTGGGRPGKPTQGRPDRGAHLICGAGGVHHRRRIRAREGQMAKPTEVIREPARRRTKPGVRHQRILRTQSSVSAISPRWIPTSFAFSAAVIGPPLPSPITMSPFLLLILPIAETTAAVPQAKTSRSFSLAASARHCSML